MVSKNNQIKYEKWNANRKPHYGLRKLSIGVASVLLGTTLYWGGTTVLADTNAPVTPLLRKLNRPQQIRRIVKIKNLVLI